MPITEVTSIATGLYLEGLAIDPLRGRIWYSDVIAGGIRALAPEGEVITLNPERQWTGGILVNHDGCVLSSGPGGILWNDPATGKSGWLVEGSALGPVSGVNEMVPDGQGGLFFGTCDIDRIAAGKATRPTRIYHLTRDRTLVPASDDIGFANGLMYDIPGNRFYCNDTFCGTWVFDVADDLTLSNQRKLIDKADADGLAIDEAGNAWITGCRSSQVTRISREGALLPPVQTPAGAVTQLRFAGQDRRDVYFTAVPAESGDNLKDGIAPTEAQSRLYRGRSEVPGAVLPPTGFDLT
jgi:sugar lactone lactonase YvrE